MNVKHSKVEQLSRGNCNNCKLLLKIEIFTHETMTEILATSLPFTFPHCSVQKRCNNLTVCMPVTGVVGVGARPPSVGKRSAFAGEIKYWSMQ